MIVMKFGGTSVESASAIERVAGIVRGRLDRKPVVVVSAMGKTTNNLLDIAARRCQWQRAIKRSHCCSTCAIFTCASPGMERTVDAAFPGDLPRSDQGPVDARAN